MYIYMSASVTDLQTRDELQVCHSLSLLSLFLSLYFSLSHTHTLHTHTHELLQRLRHSLTDNRQSYKFVKTYADVC